MAASRPLPFETLPRPGVSDVAGGATPVLPAPPVVTCAAAGPARTVLTATRRAVIIRVMGPSFVS